MSQKEVMMPTDGHGCKYKPFVAPAKKRTKEERVAEIAEEIVKAGEQGNIIALQRHFRSMEEQKLTEIDISEPLNRRNSPVAVCKKLQRLISQVQNTAKLAQSDLPPEVTAKNLRCTAEKKQHDSTYRSGRSGVIAMAAGAR